jgi:hypothetical protein
MITPSSTKFLFTAVLLCIFSAHICVSATPYIQKTFQKPFKLATPDAEPAHSPADPATLPSLDSALKALSEVSYQVIETFETVMSELGGEVTKYLSWSLPQKEVTHRPHDWDYTVSTTALPEHSLRVKKPRGLGVDDVKQVKRIPSQSRSLVRH